MPIPRTPLATCQGNRPDRVGLRTLIQGAAGENNYPVFKTCCQRVVEPGGGIDPAGTLPDGTKISGILDLKKRVVANINEFSGQPRGEALMYATGRLLSYVERREIAELVRETS